MNYEDEYRVQGFRPIDISIGNDTSIDWESVKLHIPKYLSEIGYEVDEKNPSIIKDITITNKWIDASCQGYLFYNVVFENCYFSRGSMYSLQKTLGIYPSPTVRSSDNLVIECAGCTFNNCKFGDIKRSRLTGCVFRDCTFGRIALCDFNDAHMTRCLLTGHVYQSMIRTTCFEECKVIPDTSLTGSNIVMFDKCELVFPLTKSKGSSLVNSRLMQCSLDLPIYDSLASLIMNKNDIATDEPWKASDKFNLSDVMLINTLISNSHRMDWDINLLNKYAKLPEIMSDEFEEYTDDGDPIGWKLAGFNMYGIFNRAGVYNRYFIKLRIPKDAKIIKGLNECYSTYGTKYRCNKAEVIGIYKVNPEMFSEEALKDTTFDWYEILLDKYDILVPANDETVRSMYDGKFFYQVGKKITPEKEFNDDPYVTCGSGIHFFKNYKSLLKTYFCY